MNKLLLFLIGIIVSAIQGCAQLRPSTDAIDRLHVRAAERDGAGQLEET
jgi:hypothetical protein